MKKIALLRALIAALSLASCKRTCRCYHYNGTIREYTEADLDEMDLVCTSVGDINYGLTYSYCEWVF